MTEDIYTLRRTTFCIGLSLFFTATVVFGGVTRRKLTPYVRTSWADCDLLISSIFADGKSALGLDDDDDDDDEVVAPEFESLFGIWLQGCVIRLV